jgi:hypothetical protein
LVGWGAEEWTAASQAVLAVAVISGGIWGLYTYAQGQRAQRGQWLSNIFADFYCKYSFRNVRATFEHDYDGTLGPLVQQRVTDRELPTTEDEIALLMELDNLLNYFENILYLEEQGLLRKKERLALFQYWFDLLCADECGGIRHYINRSSWQRVTDLVGRSRRHFVLVSRPLPGENSPALDLSRLHFLQTDSICGRSNPLDGGAVAFDGAPETPEGDLFEIKDVSILAELDRLHHFNPGERATSPLVRNCARTTNRRVDAWFYESDPTLGPGGLPAATPRSRHATKASGASAG